ncbi:MAG: TAXI family TRAP transporter solute-binding subunit [Xanthobacteraceae bacterium]|nr:MAG: TAXI family TRAP transporter solute-binding subunit [Xanthobacteraceae bacterium]
MMRAPLPSLRHLFNSATRIAAGVLAVIATLAPALAQQQQVRTADRINANTLTVISGNVNGTYLSIAYDLSAVLDDGDNLRILPVIGKGGGQNVVDVRYLKGIDLGITQAPLLEQLRRAGGLGDIHEKIAYIAKLFNEEMHLVVRSDITSIEQLQGKKVNFSDVGSGTQLSTRNIFALLGLKVEEVNLGQADAFEAMKRGEVAATVLIAGKPAGAMAKLKLTDGFRLLPVPYAKALQQSYLPSEFAAEEYPGLIEPGQKVPSIAVSAILVAYNWPKDTDRYQRIAKFINAFFPRVQAGDFSKAPRHPKWREINLTAVVPGWNRFPAAEDWLQRTRAQASSGRENFQKFLETRQKPSDATAMSAAERTRLFEEFEKWNQLRATNR